MPQIKVLVGERLAVDRDAARPVPLEDIPPLDHELLDNSMKWCFQVPGRVRTSQKFAGAHPPEVFCGFWRFVTKQLHLYPSTGNSTNGDVEEDDGVASGNSVQDDGVRHRDAHGRDAWRGGQAAIYDALPAPSFMALRRCGGVRRSMSVARRFAAMCGSGHSCCYSASIHASVAAELQRAPRNEAPSKAGLLSGPDRGTMANARLIQS